MWLKKKKCASNPPPLEKKQKKKKKKKKEKRNSLRTKLVRYLFTVYISFLFLLVYVHNVGPTRKELHDENTGIQKPTCQNENVTFRSFFFFFFLPFFDFFE